MTNGRLSADAILGLLDTVTVLWNGSVWDEIARADFASATTYTPVAGGMIPVGTLAYPSSTILLTPTSAVTLDASMPVAIDGLVLGQRVTFIGGTYPTTFLNSGRLKLNGDCPLGNQQSLTLVFGGYYLVEVARSNPVIPTVTVPIAGSREPVWDGYLAWTDDPAIATGSYLAASGNLMVGYCRAVRGVTAGNTVNAKLYMTVTGSGLTEGRVGIYRSDGTLLASSANMSATWNGGATGVQTVPLTVSVDIVAGDYLYLAVISVGTTPPTWTATAQANAVNAIAVRRGVRGGQTGLPTPLGAPTNANQIPWIGVL
ncbi:hypothetical protein MF271_19295 (plasmid) [Deinococcus sp. KNUC1210]|uniref:hypothetical protein n=1 Tax=Deinococcus sp. KNUC1210 TaxID=2917691 RepID=UPI001EF071BA|nr:hypothetical protein [Deinococcus sp. KNUC1210]ULH17337.1 hypothetical protein MF271_19295 [Deinococcus sp. KNUC1210]